MTDTTRLEIDSEHRVALDLAFHIAQYEKVDSKDRKYWLQLYQNCLMVVSGATAERALEEH